MKYRTGAVLVAGASLALAMTATVPAANADTARHSKTTKSVPVITLQNGSQPGTVDVGRARVRPGPVEFRTLHSKDEIAIVKVDPQKTQEAFAQLGIMFGPDSQTTPPDQVAAAAVKFQSLAKLYGGGTKGMRWQVRLKAGNYVAVNIVTNAVGSLKVAGNKRKGPLHRYDSWIHTVLPNRFQTSKEPHGGWVQFKNTSHEIHFVDGQGVKKSTTGKDVRKAFASPNPPTFNTKKHFALGAISPGVDARYRVKIDKGRYLLACFWPGTSDGMPHALMGMWKLVNFVKP